MVKSVVATGGLPPARPATRCSGDAVIQGESCCSYTVRACRSHLEGFYLPTFFSTCEFLKYTIGIHWYPLVHHWFEGIIQLGVSAGLGPAPYHG